MEEETKRLIRGLIYSFGFLISWGVGSISGMIIFALLDIEWTINDAKKEILEEIRGD